MAKLWGGRFTQSTDSFTDHFHSSISFDSRMYQEDITGSMAHAAMLGKQGIIPADDAALIIKTLKEILVDIEAGKVTFDEKAEDIHMKPSSSAVSVMSANACIPAAAVTIRWHWISVCIPKRKSSRLKNW